MHLDSHRYFPSVDHACLLELLEPRIRDTRILELLREILDSGWRLYSRPKVRHFFGLEPLVADTRRHGLPIGNLTSQWWGNLYLSGLDQFAKRTLKARGYLRYMDDLALFADNRVTLKRWRMEIIDWLGGERWLALNRYKAHIRPTRLPVTVLGYRVTPAGYDLGAKAMGRFRERLQPRALEGSEAFERSLVSWRGTVLW